MGFSVSFNPAFQPGVADHTDVSPESSDDYETLIIESCKVLADAGGGRFRIGGFGSDEWPLDVGYDLSAFMEQLPSLLAGVREGREVEVDLYSQGVERTLTFQPSQDLVMIHCESRTNWVPNPECESIAQNELVSMLTKLAEDFTRALKAIKSDLSGVPPFEHWLKGEV